MDYKDIFSRNIGLLTEKEQEKLRKSRIAIAGLGGVGGVQAVALARTGIGMINIADPGEYSAPDMNRQYGATIYTLGKNKADVMKKILKSINPSVKIKKFYSLDKHLDDFLDADIVIEAIEYFSLKDKIDLYKSARKKGVYVLTSPIIGYGSSLLVFSPNGLSFEEFFGFSKKKTEKKDYFRYGERLCPIKPNYLKPDPYMPALRGERPLPSLCLSTFLSASLIAKESLDILLGKSPVIVPRCIQVDLHRRSYNIIDFSKNGRV